MARLSATEYKRIREVLRRIQHREPALLQALRPSDRKALLNYFGVGSHREPTDYRAAITHQYPKLPQQAGRALVKLKASLSTTSSTFGQQELKYLTPDPKAVEEGMELLQRFVALRDTPGVMEEMHLIFDAMAERAKQEDKKNK